MAEQFQSLTDKEKETLRLLVKGYDTKTIARHFELSVHTINERLRSARRKMSVSSSREAARLLCSREADDPKFLTDTILGEAGTSANAVAMAAPASGLGKGMVPAMLTGVIVMSLLFAALAVLPPSSQAVPEPFPVAEQSVIAGSEAADAALQWLALIDQYQWEASWNATGKAFRDLNTLATWSAVAQKVQPPLGAVSSRVLKSQESVPAPPMGYEMIKFQTSFTHKSDAIETLTLERENGQWKVVGYWID